LVDLLSFCLIEGGLYLCLPRQSGLTGFAFRSGVLFFLFDTFLFLAALGARLSTPIPWGVASGFLGVFFLVFFCLF